MPLSRERIIKGINNPGLAVQFLRGTYLEPGIYTVINTHMTVKERGKKSEYGLVINWGHHFRNNWPVALYPFLVNALIEEYDPVLITTQRAYERHKDDLKYIISFEGCSKKAPAITFDEDAHRVIAMFVGHTHDKIPWFTDYVDNHNIDYVLSRYHDPFFLHFPDFDRGRFVHVPWSVPEQFIRDPEDVHFYGQEKIHLFGASTGDMYAQRRRCMEYPFVATHSNTGVDKKMSDADYYRWCRNFDAVVAAGSFEEQYQFVFAKYFEIAAAGSLLFAQYCGDLERLGFDSSNAVIFHKGEFEQKAREYLTDPRSYLERRKKAVERIHERHTTSKRIKMIDRILHGEKDEAGREIMT